MLPANLPFRIGTTSYIIPADILPNARFLAGKVRDIQLVLFELDDSQGNLPDATQVSELNDLARKHDLSYTVHLPLDLRLGETGKDLHLSLQKARRVIESTRNLHPLAYVAHLDGKEERRMTDPAKIIQWQQQAADSLLQAAHWTGDIKLLAIENLEGYPIDFNDAVITKTGSSRCIDVGHLWLDGHDPEEYFPGRLEQTSIIHIHGIHERDHQSLAHMSTERVDAVFTYLLHNDYPGVVTLEVFSEDDFNSSMRIAAESMQRVRERDMHG